MSNDKQASNDKKVSSDKKAHWQQTLSAARAELLTFLQTLAPAQWENTVISEGDTWSLTHVIGHLVDSERGMSIQIHKIRKGQEASPEGFNVERWNAGLKERMGNPSPAELVAALETTRAKTLEVMNSLQENDWALIGRHPSRGMISIEQYYETIAYHDRLHLADIKRALDL